jgi:hypothetical protein
MTTDKTLLKRNKILFICFYPVIFIAAMNLVYYLVMLIGFLMQKLGILDAFLAFMDFILLK